MIENKLKAMIERGERPVQLCVMSGSTIVAHNLAQTGVDSVWIDTEHGAGSIDTLGDLVMAVGHENCPFVRVPTLDRGVVGRAVMDAGVHGVICPHVDTAEQARTLVDYCEHYAQLRALRTVGSANVSRECLAVAMIESTTGFANLEEICATPGLFGILPGPSDLSYSFGGPATANFEDETARVRLQRIVDVAHEHGLYVALPARGREQLELVLDMGTDYTILPGHDMSLVVDACRDTLAMVHEVHAERAAAAG